MRWVVLIELDLLHDFYAPDAPPVTARAADPNVFDREGLLLRQTDGRVFVLAEEDNVDLPDAVTIDLVVQDTDLLAVTAAANWTHVPQLVLGEKAEDVRLTHDVAAQMLQTPGRLRLAQVTAALTAGTKRKVTAQFSAVASHWAYHVIGPGNTDVMVQDPDGAVSFEAIGPVNLPDGRPAHVIRSRDALPARARPGQRFILQRPGPFGPRTVIPVLPAPQPIFAQAPSPDGTGAIIQSDIYVSIF